MLIYRMIMPSSYMLSSNFAVVLEASLFGQLFIFWTIVQPWTLSFRIPAA